MLGPAWLREAYSPMLPHKKTYTRHISTSTPSAPASAAAALLSCSAFYCCAVLAVCCGWAVPPWALCHSCHKSLQGLEQLSSVSATWLRHSLEAICRAWLFHFHACIECVLLAFPSSSLATLLPGNRYAFKQGIRQSSSSRVLKYITLAAGSATSAICRLLQMNIPQWHDANQLTTATSLV